jgi:hypothetical protein
MVGVNALYVKALTTPAVGSGFVSCGEPDAGTLGRPSIGPATGRHFTAETASA